MIKRVLWIEDAARTDLMEVAAPVFTHGGYDLSIAEDPTEALRKICERKFNAIIVDLRLGPGDDKRWIDLYNQLGGEKSLALMGIQLVKSLLRSPKADVPLKREEIPDWIAPECFGFFTVEPWRETEKHLKGLGITSDVYVEKGPQNSRRVLLELIERVLQRRGA